MTKRTDAPGASDAGSPRVAVGLSAVVVAVTDEVPRVVTVSRMPGPLEGTSTARPALPFGTLDPDGDKTLERALRRWVREQTGLELGYVEQLYTFGDRHRWPAEHRGGPRGVTVAYLALVRQQHAGVTWPGAAGRWSDIYGFFPWEDWRQGHPSSLTRQVAPALAAWCEASPDEATAERRRQRCDIAFGLRGVRWDDERVLERYELLYEAGLVQERCTDARAVPGGVDPGAGVEPAGEGLGEAMALDHRRILATALGRLRGKLKYRPVVFELLARRFTLLELQRLVEALSGVRLHKQNFRRLVLSGGLVEGTGVRDRGTGGRPAELFEFRPDVLRERPAPGVGLPPRPRGGATSGGA